MSPRSATLLAGASWVIIAVVCALNIALFRGRVMTPPPTNLPSSIAEVLFLLMPLAFGSVGALVASRRRDNPIGWILCAGFLCIAWYSFAAGYAWSGLVVTPGSLPWAEIAGWMTNWLWMPGPLAIALTLQLFPDGRVLGPRWRLAVWTPGVGFAIVVAVGAVAPGRLNNIESVDNPFGWEGLAGLGGGAFAFGGLMELVAFGLGFASIAVRFHRSHGIERQQLKWLAFAGSFLPLVAVVNVSTTLLGSWGLLLVWTAIYAIPLAIGLAILRYRLYDIDVVIRRTLIYGLLTAGLLAVYAACVVVLESLFQGLTGRQSDLAIVGSTLVIAALFQPARRRVQATVDQRLYRSRYDAALTLEAFSSRLRQVIDLDSLHRELLAVVSRTMQPDSLSLWLRTPNTGRSRNDPGTIGR